ncbi:hypothetical protein KDA_42670 [Dictyobacter alpinus]|uniref:Uncharacterized protein n=1 Tax=Dictyobacter alpinus TaxID=2014873 RepID=A0A402BBL7_9CHLR|nr:hypothetical protein [Dictyobacter alpinus]GCE28783.1 hypothetical protein KDA_42670 [Dictyobacter alpinus]
MSQIEVPYLEMFGQVAPAYQHRQKQVMPREALSTAHVYLKWYDIYRQETPIPAELGAEARSFLLSELERGKLPLKDEVGFAIHHQCSSVYILYICSWRNENEVWETLYIKDLTTDGPFQKVRREDTTPTFCVWVLAAVWHEQQAWTRYLSSSRDDAAKHAYVQDQFEGLV